MGRLELGGRSRLCTRVRRDCKQLGNGEALIDYKFHMFKQPDGSFQYMFYLNDDLNIGYQGNQNIYRYQLFVNQLNQPTKLASHANFDAKVHQHQLPALNQMLDFSKKLMTELDYARIDWYYIDGKIYFGEITLTPSAGANFRYGEQLDKELGAMWHYNPSSH
ncbi:ATP-grasp fold amidoligase family protein [Entomospira culicis]|uniref:TupA-like ATPgrasp n=1 Tax=Entomospira culicis TaxID=2719989 RepID=A0A968GJD6_9SPIO|nr:ATP-grasp fold amidoligase family protein [Entomospira culicis]NIZ19916.1 hypothetical protein [Entomospira culicis]NIZ70127.1 hypothetical protein [Entomospira culicis]WDI38054.1 ATP-grasp fold amidoligase family protein [Entomospira culicis]WDI39677.1 ATP-grasp fold amidoligase family protein [Entomospira culicis]